MREILFRGKDIKGNWRKGGFHLWKTRQPCVIDDELKPDEIKNIIIENSFADWNMPRNMQPYEVIPETVGQYTGLTDKNGTKIFEGDIINGYTFRGTNDFRNCIVEWSDLFCGWRAGKKYSLYFECGVEYEVIGNIHDNPELLGGEG